MNNTKSLNLLKIDHKSRLASQYSSIKSCPPLEGHKFEPAKNEPRETACRMAGPKSLISRRGIETKTGLWKVSSKQYNSLTRHCIYSRLLTNNDDLSRKGRGICNKAAFTLAENKHIFPDWGSGTKCQRGFSRRTAFTQNIFPLPLGDTSSNRRRMSRVRLRAEGLRARERGYCKKAAFTLAEVLITLLIIGVVAALTLPTLMQNISDRKNSTKVAVFNSKFIQGLNLTKNAGEMGTQYSSTYDFLKNGLSNHLKMASICDSDHLKDCLGYDEITYEDKNEKEKTEKVSSLKTAKSLNIKDSGFKDTAAFIMGDGTPVLLTYNLNCMDDSGVDKTISSCVAGLFDLNGKSQPNMFINKVTTLKSGKIKTEAHDIRSFNGASIRGCFGRINDLCIANSTFIPNDNFYNTVVKPALGDSYVRPTYEQYNKNYNDNWQLAKDYCEKVVGGHMPTSDELAQIATVLYGTSFSAKTAMWGLSMKNKDAVYAALGITDNSSGIGGIWSSSPAYASIIGYNRRLDSSGSFLSDDYKDNRLNMKAICLND